MGSIEKYTENLPVAAVPPIETNVPFGRDNIFYLIWDSCENLSTLVLAILGLSQLDNMAVPVEKPRWVF